MPKQPGNEASNIKEQVRFQRSAVHQRQLLILTRVVGALALATALAGIANAAESFRVWSTLLLNSAAALLLFTGVVYSACRVSRWRSIAFDGGTATPPEPSQQPQSGEWLDSSIAMIKRQLSRVAAGSEGFAAAAAMLALWSVRGAWDFGLAAIPSGTAQYVIVGIGLVVAFGLLVLERYFAACSDVEWPEARPLAQLTRATIATILVCILCAGAGNAERLWPSRVAVLTGILPALMAIEILLRAGAAALVRSTQHREPRLIFPGFIAQFLQWPPRPIGVLQDELYQRFGIDLRRNWAFGFARRAFLPVVAVIMLCGWLLTGIAELALNERGVYERFGAAVEVWQPGLHLGLPWPLGTVRRVENGVVHELATSIPSEARGEPDSSNAEGPAPVTADRLWDVSHVAENAQIISSATDAKQSFQIVNMDVRFVYRIGLSDDDALFATYRCVDIPELIRSIAGRVLVSDFASRTLDGLLGADRDVLAHDIGQAVQAELDQFDSGVDILATLIESIHPPAGAAAAYHSVQSAQISAQSIVARERGYAATQINDAQRIASTVRDDATAIAREQLDVAEVARLGFDADRDSYRSAGGTFLRERYFSQLVQGLANSRLLIIDHRIAPGSAPTIDLRSWSPGGSSPGEP